MQTFVEHITKVSELIRKQSYLLCKSDSGAYSETKLTLHTDKKRCKSERGE